MKVKKNILHFGRKGWVLLMITAVLGLAAHSDAGNVGAKSRVPEGVYIDLTRDFYEALRREGNAGGTSYSNDPSEGYLKQIALSARFMVETNLQILKAQEETNRLLIRLLEKKGK